MLEKSLGAPRVAFITTVPLSAHFLRGHLRHLRSRGFEMHFISSSGPQMDELAAEGIVVHTMPMSRKISPLADFAGIVRLTRLLRRIRPQIVHAYTPKAVLLGATAARLARVPKVAVSMFGLRQMDMQGKMRWILDAATRWSCRLADWVWCDSRTLGDYLVEAKLCDAQKLTVLCSGSASGVDAEVKFTPDRFSSEERRALRNAYGIPEDAITIGFVGRVVRDKGIGELLAAWRILREQHPKLRLCVIGPQEETDPIASADRDLLEHDERIHVVGLQQNVALHLAITDVFVNASYREGFCMSNAEAAAMAVPVVTTRIPGNIDTVVDGVTGTLVPVRDHRALADAIERYLIDPELRRRHGTAGRQRMLNDFRPQDCCSALESQYWKMLEVEPPSATPLATEH